MMRDKAVTALSVSESKPSDKSMPLLNVPAMHKPILENFDEHVKNFIHFLGKRVNCILVYDGPEDVYQHILERTVYACSVKHVPSGKIIRNVFPVMLGTQLDMAIRHLKVRVFNPVVPAVQSPPFQMLDMGRCFFIIGGYLRQLPYFFTNDPSRTHIVYKHSVRIFTYDACDRGKQLSLYTHDERRGQLIAKNNKGVESEELVERFFDFCPYPTDQTSYMAHVYRHDSFDIDSLTNKVVYSPGHIFTKLFVKYLYDPLRHVKPCWSLVKSKASLVTKSIESGKLMHVISQKTKFFKEGKDGQPHENHREIGANGEVFAEKNMESYRDINSHTYPLNPYLCHLIVRQTSNKVNSNAMPSTHDSYLGFLGILGIFETKNVGRTSMMARDTYVSTCFDLEPTYHDGSEFWTWLRLDTVLSSSYYVVVNEACIPVTQACFDGLDLLAIKRKFRHVECLKETPFIHISLKAGLFYKKLPGTDVWVTPRDLMYWANILFGIEHRDQLQNAFGYNFITSYIVDLNPWFNHNAFPKDILAFNSLKNAVLALDKRCAEYFMDTVSVYGRGLTKYHKVYIKPVEDGISPHFTMFIPHVMVTYMSFMGLTQEDCIVRRKDVNAFDSFRFFTIRLRVEGDGLIVFYPVQGDADESNLLGTVVHHGQQPLKLESYSMHLKMIPVTDQVIHLHFAKAPFRVIRHNLSANILSICVEQEHFTSMGDKLCSFHGQKGVMSLRDKLPLLDESVTPDLIVNPYCWNRMTSGQIHESRAKGGRDAFMVRNTNGKIVRGTPFYGKTFYFPIAYWASEHLYANENCTLDIVTGLPVRGRSRNGGMRCGTMEMNNTLRGNGLASCAEEKFFEHGDRKLMKRTAVVPKTLELIQEDARFFKFKLDYKTHETVTLQKLNTVETEERPCKKRKITHSDS